MKIHFLLLSCALSMISFQSIVASECTEECDPCQEEGLFSHQVFIGPEIYGVKRTKEGGAEQTGYLAGVRLGYDRVKSRCLYWGIEALYAQGTLEGHSGVNEKLKSYLMDANVEGRLGYTFEISDYWHFSFTPFLGIGYFWEHNNYQKPSPLTVHFKNQFSYVPVGFLSRFFISSKISLGINFKARFLIDAKVKVENDCELGTQIESDHVALHYEEKLQYRVDIPLIYYFCLCEKEAMIGVVPFYEYRHYGHRANFPFDFLETKFQLYGVAIRLGGFF